MRNVPETFDRSRQRAVRALTKGQMGSSLRRELTRPAPGQAVMPATTVRAQVAIGATSEKANIIIRCGIAAGSNSYATVWVDAAWAALRRLYQITATKAPTAITPATMIAKIACWRNAIIGTATAISSATKQSRHDAA